MELGPFLTDARGRFRLEIPRVVPKVYQGSDGQLDLEVTGTDGVSAAPFNVSAQWKTPSHGDNAQLVLADSPLDVTAEKADVPRLRIDVGEEQATDMAQRSARLAKSAEDPADVPAPPVVMSAQAAGMSAHVPAGDIERSAAVASSNWHCWGEAGARHGRYRERYATFFGTAHAKGRVQHRKNSRHVVGVAVKAPGSSSWGQSGTTRADWTEAGYNTDFTIVNANVYNRIWQRYHYAKCRELGTNKLETTTSSRPDGFADGPLYSQVAYTSYPTCSPAYVGHTYTRSSNSNREYGGGLNLGFVNVSSQAGWTSELIMGWKFTRQGQLCGNGGNTWASAKRVSAKTN